jgi:hypothetical protein
LERICYGCELARVAGSLGLHCDPRHRRFENRAQPDKTCWRGATRGGWGRVVAGRRLDLSSTGASGACAENCSHWLAAEGTVHWDGYKRFIAGLDRFADRKRPVFLNVRGQSNLNVAMSIGRLLRERGYDVGVGQTIADQCRGLNDSDCVALKRSGVSLPASLSSIGTCDLACVLILAGGVRRTLPEDTTVLIQSAQIVNRLGLNVSDEHREGLHAHFREQIKLYFAQMGVDPALADTIDANYGIARKTQLSRADMVRLRIVTGR